MPIARRDKAPQHGNMETGLNWCPVLLPRHLGDLLPTAARQGTAASPDAVLGAVVIIMCSRDSFPRRRPTTDLVPASPAPQILPDMSKMRMSWGTGSVNLLAPSAVPRTVSAAAEKAKKRPPASDGTPPAAGRITRDRPVPSFRDGRRLEDSAGSRYICGTPESCTRLCIPRRVE